MATIEGWLFDLKSLLPDHAAYAVHTTLGRWVTWVDSAHEGGGDWSKAKSLVRNQGQVWRGLLSGEKQAKDLLKLASYLSAAKAVVGRVVRSLYHYLWLVVLAGVLLVGGLTLVVLIHNISPSVRIVSALAWFAGVAGVSLKGLGSLLGGALTDVESWLWQSELDETIANAADCSPGPKPDTDEIEVGALELPVGTANREDAAEAVDAASAEGVIPAPVA